MRAIGLDRPSVNPTGGGLLQGTPFRIQADPCPPGEGHGGEVPIPATQVQDGLRHLQALVEAGFHRPKQRPKGGDFFQVQPEEIRSAHLDGDPEK